MGLLEKLKNTFFEEEYVEVEEKPKVIKEVHKESKKEEKPKIIRSARREREEVVNKEDATLSGKDNSNAVREETLQQVPVVEAKKEPTLEEKTLKRETSFGYFDDADFLDFNDDFYSEPPIPKRPTVQETRVQPDKNKLYDNPAYVNTSDSIGSKETKTTFKPTPIISPIYGILDKNYTKEEVLPKKEVKPSSYVSRKNADLDSVREKAFGSLTGDFGLTSDDPIKEGEAVEDEFEVEDHLLYDMSDEDKTPSVDKVTLQDAEEYFQDLGLEYNIDYKDAKLEKATGRRVSKTPKIDEIDDSVDIPKEQPASHKESSVEDNLFDLIDSMYEEKE